MGVIVTNSLTETVVTQICSPTTWQVTILPGSEDPRSALVCDGRSPLTRGLGLGSL